MVFRICERCKRITNHEHRLDNRYIECQACRKMTRRYDLRGGRVHQ